MAHVSAERISASAGSDHPRTEARTPIAIEGATQIRSTYIWALAAVLRRQRASAALRMSVQVHKAAA